MMAPTGRNRRAGELLGTGTPAEEIPALIGQASEGIDTTPLLADMVASSQVKGDALEGLAKLIRGEVAAEEWVAGLRSAERARQAA
jgi:glycerol-3-phosphate dehydrogenase